MNIRRTLAIGALAALAVALPSAAMATTYPAPEAALTCEAGQVAPGAAFNCTSTGIDGDSHQLQATTAGENASIAGTVTSDAKIVEDGSVAWTVTAPADSGTVGLSLIVNGVAADTSTVVVADAPAGDDAAAGDGLAVTGFENTGLAIGAGALLIAGAGAVVITARRRAGQQV